MDALASWLAPLGGLPLYHVAVELLLGLAVIWLLLSKSYRPGGPTGHKLTAKVPAREPWRPGVARRDAHDACAHAQEVDQLIDEWEPEPLVPSAAAGRPRDLERMLHAPVADGLVGAHVSVHGRDMLNLISVDFSGFIGNPVLHRAAVDALHQYGVGSCGPRGFYGTIGAPGCGTVLRGTADPVCRA